MSNATGNNIIVVTEDGQEKAVRVFGTIYDPHFCGKDICDILEITDFKQALKDIVQNIHKKELKYLLDEENNAPLPPSWLGVLKTPALLGSIDPENISYHDGRLVVLSEPGVYDLLNGTRKRKNKEILRDAISKAIYTIKYKDSAGLMDIFSFISKLNLAIDIGSNWFQDLWYPLSKVQGSPGAALTKVNFHPIIITSNLLDWMGYKGKKEADKQLSFSRLLESLNIPYEEINYKHPLAIEYPGIQKEIQTIPKNNIERKRWICMEPRAFKNTILMLNTENAGLIRQYYLNLEEAMFAYGEYTMEYVIQQRDKEMAIAMEQLAIKDKEAETAREAEEELKEQLTQEKERAERIQEELEDTREHALILQEMMIKDEPIEQTQVIYIATTELYAKSNNFKPGGVDDTGKLKSRLSTYNTGRLKEDLFYYSDVFMVSNYHVIEAQLKNLLGRFRNKKEKEMYRMHYNDMKYIVEYLCKRDGEDVNEVNLKLGEFISNLNRRVLRPVVPDPDTRYISSTVQLNEDGTVTNTTIQSKTPQEFRLQLEAYIRGLDSATTTISKKKVFDDLNVKKDRVNKLPLLQQLLRQLKPQIRLIQKSH